MDLEQLTDLQTPWCVHTVATLRIADHVAAGTDRLAELAAAAGCSAEPLRAVLSWLIGKGVFTEPEPGRYALNDLAEQLRGPGARFLDLAGIGGRMASAWETLPTYVRTGRPGYAERFGRPFWDDLAAHPRLGADFDELMGPAGHGAPDAALELADGWAGVRTVVDVGGGTGAFLAALLRARPGVHGTLVDLPGTVDRVGAAFADVPDRVTVVGGSFFDPLPAGADLYVLRKVLNDWPAAETEAILRRCADAARPGGRLVVLGGVVPDEAPRPLQIEQLLLGGSIDPLATFTERAARAGLTVVAAGAQPSGRYAVELIPGPPPGRSAAAGGG